MNMKRSVRQIAEFIGASLADGGVRVSDIEISGVGSIESATAEDLVFVEDEKYLSSALQSRAGAVIAGEFAASALSERPILICSHPKLAFARAFRLLTEQTAEPTKASDAEVHPSAVVDSTAGLGPRVRIEARAVIAASVQIGAGTEVGSGCAIGLGASIGRDCRIYPNVTIYPGTSLGDRVIVHAGAVLGSDGFGYVRDAKTGAYEKFPQAGRLVIEDDVEIGANATIDRGALEETRVRRGAKIDNLVHIGHNCQIGEDVIIAAQTGLSGSIVIENGAVLGGQVGIGEHARIGEGVMIGGQGGVLPKKILRGKGVAFWGTPAQPLRQYLKQLATLSRLAKRNVED